jgi:hypothetical protein
LPAKLLLAKPHQAHETVGGSLGVGEGVVGLAVGYPEALAEALQTDGVLELEEDTSHARGVEVVVVERTSERLGDEASVEAIGGVLDQD